MVNYIHTVSNSKIDQMWNNMYTRCYNHNYHKGSPNYTDCEICPEWTEDRQSFREWVRENYYSCDDERVDLDKDILVKGNKIYSPDTCIFAPHSINSLFENSVIRQPEYMKQSNTYKMGIMINGKKMTIGYFPTELEAKQAYILHKTAALIAKADLYKDKIPKKLYDAMVNWKIELADWEH